MSLRTNEITAGLDASPSYVIGVFTLVIAASIPMTALFVGSIAVLVNVLVGQLLAGLGLWLLWSDGDG